MTHNHRQHENDGKELIVTPKTENKSWNTTCYGLDGSRSDVDDQHWNFSNHAPENITN